MALRLEEHHDAEASHRKVHRIPALTIEQLTLILPVVVIATGNSSACVNPEQGSI